MTALGLVLETTDQMLLLGGSGRELSRSAKKELVRAADAIAVVLAQLRKEQRLEREAVAARTGTETSHRLALSAVDLDEFIRLLLELAMSATRSEGGFVAVADDQGTLRVSSVAGVAGQLAPGLDLGRDSGLFDWQATAPGAPLIVRDAAAAERLGIRSLLAAPIERGNAPVGVFALMTVTRRAEFDADTMRLLSSFVDQVGLMLESTKTFERFTQQFLLVLEGISRAVDARRPGPHSYHQLTGRLADEIGTLLGMSPEAAGDLRRAGQVHDVGLAALPASRDSYLVDVEHPQVAAGLLSTLPVRTSIVEAVRSHHEWYDGWGFPSGLAGEEIPLTGRILAVAAFAADLAVGNGLTPAWEWSRIAEEIRVRSGKQFDPRVVDLAVPLIESLPSVAEMA